MYFYLKLVNYVIEQQNKLEILLVVDVLEIKVPLITQYSFISKWKAIKTSQIILKFLPY